MEGSFYPGFWSSRPVRPRAAPPTVPKSSSPAKVVSIPVHFINSNEKNEQRQPTGKTASSASAAVAIRPSARMTTSAAALQIQRFFRGFLVRKNLKAVRRLEAEVDAVEREVERAAERLRRDAKERLRVSESLMSLLFRLDSVRGVRDYRRRVIRRAIALQEAVDAMAADKETTEGAAATAAGNDVGEGSETKAPHGTPEAQDPIPTENPRPADSSLEDPEDHAEAPPSGDEDRGEKAVVEESAGEGSFAEEYKEEEAEGTGAGTTEETLEEIRAEEAPGMEENASEKGSAAVATREDSSEDHGGDQPKDVTQVSTLQDVGIGRVETGEGFAPASDIADGEAGEECGDETRKVMERMVEESKGLKGLVAELCERNETQLRLMDGLLRRVERLEKVVEKMGTKEEEEEKKKKKKKRQAADAKRCCARRCDRKL